jgi:hypothetical protein
MPNTVFDKGIWGVDGDILELKSDPEIVWNSPEHTKIQLSPAHPSMQIASY